MAERLDIVLFGASGFTGRHCIEYINKFTKENGSNTYTWGIAGRSEEKLKQSLLECQNYIGKDLSSIPILLADVKDYESLKEMTARAKVLINCCGPYRYFGEPVVRACIETGTHQVDVSGEPQYMESIQLQYNKAAEEKGVYIVSACGFDSIPCDLGMVYLENNFEGTLNSSEVYMQTSSNLKSGALVNYGTWESLIHSMVHSCELKELRKKLFSTRLPDFLPKLKPKPLVHKCDVTDTWNLPFMGADRSVMVRTQRYLYEQNNKRPVQVQVYLGFQSLLTIVALMIFGSLFSVLVKYRFGQNLLLKHPKFFSNGMFSHEGPTRAKMESTKFKVTFIGQGWPEKLATAEDTYTTPPTSRIVARISGSDPAYGVTCTAVTLAAILILQEPDKLPSRGGVFTPGAVFCSTSLIERLQNSKCMNFEITNKL